MRQILVIRSPLARWLPDVSRGTVAALLLLTPVAAPIAYASGFAGTAVVVRGSATIATSGAVQTITIPTTSPVTTINWTPTDTAVGGGAIDFLPVASSIGSTGNTVSFIGTPPQRIGGNANPVIYNVLNRIIPVDPSRSVAFNGTVTSTSNTRVWFYSPGGLLIGATASFDVGGLVLTTADPVAPVAPATGVPGPFITTTAGADSFSFAGVSGSTSAITIAPGASIKALAVNRSNYVVAIAPRISQGGTISVAGSVALVAAESASFAVDSTGLFNITVSAGTTVANDTFVHTGSTGGPNADTSGDYQRVYMVAVPKNNAISMAIASSGSIGFAVADAANVDGNAIVLSAGSNIADTGTGNPVVAGAAGSGTASLTVGGGSTSAGSSTYTSNVYAVSTDKATVTDPLLSIGFASNLDVVAPLASVQALAGTIAVGGNLTIDADDTLTGGGGNAAVLTAGSALTVAGNALVSANGSWSSAPNDGSTATQGGTALVAVISGSVAIGGSLTVNAIGDATGSYAALTSQGQNKGATATGGSASVTVTDAKLTATNGISVNANAISGIDGNGVGGVATGGGALIVAGSGGTIGVGVDGSISASASASAADLTAPLGNGVGGNSFGGIAQVIADSGAITVAGVNGIFALAGAEGGISPGESGNGGDATGGTALIATQGTGGSIATNTSGSTATSQNGSNIDTTAEGGGAVGFGASGGNATGGTATLQLTGTGQSITIDHGNTVMIAAGATGGAGDGDRGGTGIGGSAQLLAGGGSIAITNAGLAIDAGGAGGSDNYGDGGTGTGGTTRLAVSGDGSVDAELSTSLTAKAMGGSTYSYSGGSATGGTVELTASGGGTATIAASPYMNVSATGGSGSGTGGSAVGGNIFITMGNNEINFDPVGGSPELDASFTPGDSEGGPIPSASSAGGVLVTDLGTLTLGGGLTIDSNTQFYAQAGGSIAVPGSITGTGAGAYLHLWADDLGTGTGTLTLASGALNLPGSQIDIYYNPTALGTPTDFSAGIAGGTATAYQLVNDVNQLQLVGSYLSQNFALGKNIDASATVGWNGGAGFAPIGTTAAPFTGNFDGLSHTVIGLYVANFPTSSDYFSTDGSGLFGTVQANASSILIRNIGLINSTVQTDGNGGLLVGYIAQSSCTCSVIISNDYAGGSIQGTYNIGGLIGQAINATGQSVVKVINSHSDATVSGVADVNVSGGSAIGGLIGVSENTTLENVFATGSVSASGNLISDVGGLVAYFANGQITNSYATGAVNVVSGAQNVGGLVGDLGGSNLTNSYATGNVTAGSDSFKIGGLVGLNYSNITQSWASGAVSAPGGSEVGGLVGFNRAAIASQGTAAGSITNSYWDTYSTGQTNGVGSNTATVTNLNAVTSDPSRSGADNYAFGSYAYGNFSGDWTYDNGMTRPVGAWETPVAFFGVANIESAHQVQLIDYNMAGNYLVTQNIDMRGTGGTSDIWGPEGFMPLGGIPTDPPLTGTLAGGGHVLSNLTMAPDGNFYNAALVQENYGTIKDLGLANVNITAANSFSVGAIAGYNAGQITDSFATGRITLTGAAARSGVAGGLVGENYDGSLQEGYFYGNRGTITQSYASVAISGGSAVGGLAGDNEGGIDGSFANGAVSGTQTGGLVGESSDLSGPTVTNSYWDTELTGQNEACGSLGYGGACGGATGLTTAQTLQSASFTAFSIDTQGGQGLPWRQYEGNTTPLLEAFLTPITVQPGSMTTQYDAQTPAVGVTTYGAQPSGTFGTAQVDGLNQNAGTYELTYAGGLYSNQLGYDFVPSTSPGTLVITPAPLTLGATPDYKVYDGTTSAVDSDGVYVSGIYGSDSVSNLSESFTSKNVMGANASTLVVNNGYVIDDGNGGNNYTITLQSADGTIVPAALTLAAVSDTKVYDGTSSSTGVVQVSGLFGGDNVTSLTQSFTSPNAMGTNGSTLAVDSGYVVNDGNGGANYTVTLQNALGTITPAQLMLALAAVSDTKVFDGTTGSSGIPQAMGLMGSDNVTNLSQSFTSPNVMGLNGSTLVVNPGYVVNDGNNGDNYNVTLQSAAGTITPAPLTLSAVTETRSYNATTGSTGAVQKSGLFGEDSVTNLTQSFASANALGTNGSTLVVNPGYVVNDGNDGGNYTVTLHTASGTISPAALAVTYTANSTSSTYGTTPSGLSGTVSQQGLQGSDTLASVTTGTAGFTATATAHSNVGSYAVTGAGLAGNSGNYIYSFAQAEGNATALTIGQRALTLTANPLSRIYGSANPTSDTATAALATATSGLVNGDSATSETVTSPATSGSNVGTYALNGSAAQFGSGLAANYAITYASNLTGLTITPAAATITYVANALSSIYGNAPAGLSGSENAAGLVNGDTLAKVTTGTAGFATTATGLSSVGSYGITGSGLTGNSGNYTFNFVQAAGNATALTIVQRALTLTADPLSRVYGSANPISDTATAALATDSTGLVNGDSVSSETVNSPATSGSGVGSYALNGSAAQFGSGLASNYAITFAANPAGLTITPAAATITYVANPLNSIYGNTPTGLSGSEIVSGLVNGDTLGSVTSGTAGFATTASGLSNVGSYAIIGSGLAGSTKNYGFSFVQAAGNATALTIVPRALTLTADPLSRVYGSGNPTSDTATAGATTATAGLVNGDTIASEAVTSPASSGSGVGNYALNGSAAQFGSGASTNYVITYATDAVGLSITPAALTLTYTASPAGSIYGQAPAGLTGGTTLTGLVNDDSAAGVTSGSAIWASPASATSNAGAYAINGSGIALASANYTLTSIQAPGNATALTINPAALSITYTANPASRTYGAENPALSGTETAIGLVNDDTLGSVTSGDATYTATAAATSNVGNFAITGAGLTGSSANYTYSFAQAPGNATALAITPTAVTITYTANPQTSIYGNVPRGLTGTESAAGLVNDDTLGSITSGTASYASAATSTSAVGGYAVTGSGLVADSSNYSVSFVQAPGNATALSIVPRPITVTADPQQRDVGAPDPLFTYVVTGPATTTGGIAPGLVNGDTLTGQLTSTATSTSLAGTYDIVQGNLAASANYQLNYVGNILTLNFNFTPIQDVIDTITANLPDQPGIDTPDERRKQEEAALAAVAASQGLHPPQITQSMINDHLVTTPLPVNEPVTSNGNSSLWSPTAP